MRTMLIAVFVAVFSLPALAQQPYCELREKLVERLAEKYQEAQTGLGLMGENQHMAELFSSESGGWTFVITDLKTEKSCVLAAGKFWESVRPVKPDGDGM